MEESHEHIEHAAEHGGSHAKPVAILIAALAAGLALTEFGARNGQTEYLATQVQASDVWAQYQAKSVRAALYQAQAEALDIAPNAADPAVRKLADTARGNAQRMQSEPGGDGMAQLAARAHGLERERDLAMERTHGFETASSGLQLAIVLASVSIVTGTRLLLLISAGLGILAALYGISTELALV